jgi:DNA polymerase-3 subunit delta'
MQFKDVVGQQELKRHLIQEVDKEKISHAQLFLGNAGHGGLPLALAFVQYLFCENKNALDSCGKCPSCRKVTELQHPDLHFSFPVVLTAYKKSDAALSHWRDQIKKDPYFSQNDWLKRIDEKERKATIGTDESQEIIKKLSLKSYEGGFKVMIIWMAEEMNTFCANKLLKILEEPPAKTVFILLCEKQEQLLQTILSRTQIVKIPRINTADLSLFLRNEFNLSTSNAESIVARVEGDALQAFDLVGTHHDQDENRDLFIQLMRVCYKKDVILMLDWAEQISTTGKERQKIFVQYALHMFRQSMLRNYTEDQLTRVSKEEDDFLNKFARFISGNNLQDFMLTFNDAHYHLDRNANAKILFTNLCFKVMRFIHFA